MSGRLITLDEEQVMRYLELVDRRMFIVMHSGVSWKPEYAQELEEIDQEIAVLRTAIDAAHAARHLVQGEESETVSGNVITDCENPGESPSGQEAETVSRNIATDCMHSGTTGTARHSDRSQEHESIGGESGVIRPASRCPRPGRKPPLSNT